MLSFSITTGALGSPNLLPSCSIVTNNNIIAHNDHTDYNHTLNLSTSTSTSTSFYIFLHYRSTKTDLAVSWAQA